MEPELIAILDNIQDPIRQVLVSAPPKPYKEKDTLKVLGLRQYGPLSPTGGMFHQTMRCFGR